MKSAHCPNCESPIQNQFCENCGEKRFLKQDLAFKHLLKQLFTSLTDIDNKLIKSFYLLLIKPGQLSLDYINGKRKNRLNPIQLFLICNIVYFIFASLSHQNTFKTELQTHLNAYNFIHYEMAQQLVDEKLIETGEDYKNYEKRFNTKIDVFAKSLVFLIIPIIAVVFFMVFSFPKKQYLTVKSIVYSINITSFLLCFLILQFVISIALLKGFLFLFNIDLMPYIGTEAFMSVPLFLVIWWYLFVSSKRLFKSNHGLLFLKSIIMVVAVYYAILIYRMVLFFVTFYSV